MCCCVAGVSRAAQYPAAATALHPGTYIHTRARMAPTTTLFTAGVAMHRLVQAVALTRYIWQLALPPGKYLLTIYVDALPSRGNWNTMKDFPFAWGTLLLLNGCKPPMRYSPEWEPQT